MRVGVILLATLLAALVGPLAPGAFAADLAQQQPGRVPPVAVLHFGGPSSILGQATVADR
jgi:hypothetical protein